MQKIAAYRLERRDDLEWSDARKAEAQKILARIEDWLRSKGASDTAQAGDYVAEDGSEATYDFAHAVDGHRSWSMYRLSEKSSDGRRFDASLSVTTGAKEVVFFATLEVGAVATQVKPIKVDPRCPRIVRDLIENSGPWYHGESELGGLTHLSGFAEGERLARELINERRTIPFVVVSTTGGEPVLPGLDEGFAKDLAGLANVFTADEDASWALTDALRRPLSCYSGAVRLYWPQLEIHDNPYRHFLWTASRLKALEKDEDRARERFRYQLRKLIMRASAVSVVRPREIDEIRKAAAHAQFATAKTKARSLEDYVALADSYAVENDALREELLERDEEIAELQGQLTELESVNTGLRYHLGRSKPAEDDGDVEPDQLQDAESEPGSPRPGDVRHYKKTYSAPGHDVVVRVGACGHGSWQNAKKADKAKKGIAKLEDSRDDWKSIQHCGKCTGGGMWRVEW